MTDKLKKIIQFIWPVAAFCLFLFVFFKYAYADNSLGNDAFKYLDKTLPSFGGANGSTGQDVAVNVVRRGISLIKYMIGGVAMIFGLIYAMSFVFARGKEDTISKARTNFLWLLLGFVIIMAADQVASIFNPETAKSDKLIDFQAGRDLLRNAANYIKWLFGSVIVLLMTMSGLRMVTSRGKEEILKKQKENLFFSGIGMLVILLASNIVDAVYYLNGDDYKAAQASVGITQIGGIIKLLLVFLGPVAILFTIYAGFMYLTALDNEDSAKKARKMIVAGVTGIVIIYAAYALVNTFIKVPSVPAAPTATTAAPTS
jgi:hypothetical protein